MKKKLLLLMVMTGIILVASFSVYAATDSVSVINQYGVGGYADISGNSTQRVVNIKLFFQNNSDKWAISSSDALSVQVGLGTLGSSSYINGMQITNCSGCVGTLVTSTYLTVNPRVSVTIDNGFILSPHEYRVVSFDIEFEVINSFTSSVIITFPNGYPSYNFKTIEDMTNYGRTEKSLLDKIRSILEEIRDNSSGSQIASDLNNQASQVTSQENTIHQQEQSWYQANESAINAVGLDNFQFGSGASGGLQIMQQQFSDVWSALGDLNLIWIFTLTISLGTYIIRHFAHTKDSEHVNETISHSVNNFTGEIRSFTTTTVSRRIR